MSNMSRHERAMDSLLHDDNDMAEWIHQGWIEVSNATDLSAPRRYYFWDDKNDKWVQRDKPEFWG